MIRQRSCDATWLPEHPRRPRATPSDLPGIGRLGALLIEEHYDFDPQRFLAASHRTPADYTSFMRAQLEDPNKAVLVADDNGDLIGYAYAAVEGYDYMSLRGPAGVLHDQNTKLGPEELKWCKGR
jgi:hypothetical protein